MEAYENRGRARLWAEGISGEIRALSRAHMSRSPKRFCIFAQGRTGSTLLTTLLDSHPDIRCTGEILRRPRLAPSAHVDLQSRGREMAFGFHLKPYHLTRFQRIDDIASFLRDLVEAGWQLVHLTRRDTVAHAFSGYHARRHGWHRWSDTPNETDTRIEIDPERFVRKVIKRQEWLARERTALEALDVFPICYEDHLLHPETRQARLRALLHHLGLPDRPLQTPLRKSVRGSPWERMTNPDKVRAALQRAGLPTD